MYDQLLLLGFVSDCRMQEILTVLPLHPRARPVEPSEAHHNRFTRLQCRGREEVAQQAERQENLDDPTTKPIIEPEVAAIPKTSIVEPFAEHIPSPPEPFASEVEELERRIRESELVEIEAHNIVELMNLQNHTSVNLAFNIGRGETMRTLVGALDAWDIRVLEQSKRLEVTDNIIAPLLWYDTLLCC